MNEQQQPAQKLTTASEKQRLRSEYRRIRRNYMQMIRRDMEKYLIPKSAKKFIPTIPRIISNERLYKNAAISRLQGAINKLNKYIERYKAARNSWEKLTDAKLRLYEGYLVQIITDAEKDHVFTDRARRVLDTIQDHLKTKRDRTMLSRRLDEQWESIRNKTDQYIFAYFSKAYTVEQTAREVENLFRILITTLFRPQPGDDDFFYKTWEEIEDDMQLITDDGWEDFADFDDEY